MAKTVIINGKALDNALLTEGILLEKLPADISDMLRAKQTPFGDNPAFPDEYNSNFETQLTTKRFKEVVDGLKTLGSIDDFPETKLTGMLSKLITKCQSLEEPIKPQLEKICYNTIVKLFDVPEDFVQLSAELVKSMTDSKVFIRTKSEGGINNFTSDNDRSNFTLELYKRRIINALIVGGAMRLSQKASYYMGDVYDANFKLPDIYNKILRLNEYLLFTREDVKVDDDKQAIMGASEIKLGNENTLNTITSEGMILPVLLMETIRAFLELFSSHGLPKNNSMSEKIMSITDCAEYEPWDMRLGPAMWDSFMKAAGNPDTKVIPYIFMRFCQLTPKRFLEVCREMLGETEKAETLFAKTVRKATKEAEYGAFKKRMQLRKEKQDMITDEYYRK